MDEVKPNNFAGNSVDYGQHQHAVYSRARALSPQLARHWIRVFSKYLDPFRGSTMLDLGSGTGMYSRLLAEAFEADVFGVEPSRRMREVAVRENSHPRVKYIQGSADQIPLPDAACEAALLSDVVHHVGDRVVCANELRRVIRTNGIALIRGTLRESLPRVRHFEFFPTARQIAMKQFPAVGEVVATFGGVGFEHVASETIEQETAPGLRDYLERIKLRGISTLELISDSEFEEGLKRLNQKAMRETFPDPVIEEVNLVVFRRA